MQLIYFWGSSLGRGINFNSNFYFELEMEKDNKYHLKRLKEKEKKIPKNFFGKEIESISCIIGKNGAGKTSLIKDILENQREFLEKTINLNKNIYIFEENNQIYILKKTNKLVIDFKDYILINFEEYLENIDIKYIYYTSNLSTLLPKDDNHIIDISLRGQLENKVGKEKYKGEKFFEKYYENVFQKNLEFIINESTLIENIPYDDFKEKLLKIRNEGEISCKFNLDGYIYLDNKVIKSLKLPKILDNESLNLKYFTEKNEFIEGLDILKILRAKEDEQDEFLKQLGRYIIFWFYWDLRNGRFEKILFRKILINEQEKDLKVWIKRTIDILENEIYTKNNVTSRIRLRMLKAIKMIINNDKIKFCNKEMILNYSDAKEIFKKNQNQDLLPMPDKRTLLNFQFKEKFSSGELELLKLLTSLKNCKEKVGETKNIILFFEELEAFMHPEWQRKIIDFLLTIKNSLAWLKNKKIQIIISSHTPFIVGDLLETNISFIENGKVIRSENKTFGSNIYDLFKNNFLLESCFGEFSKNKIKKVIELLTKTKDNKYKTQEIEENKEEIMFIIDNLGEPIIKKRLEKMYLEYEGKNKKDLVNDMEKIKSYMKLNELNSEEIIRILEEVKNDKNQ